MTKPAALTITLPWPPSVNGYWRSFNGRQILSKRARDYRNEATLAVYGYGRPSVLGCVRVTERFYPPDRRRRDLDNVRKAYRDAIVHCGVIEDDSKIKEDHGYMCEADKANPRVEITIERLDS